MTNVMATMVIQRIQQTHGWLLKVTEDLPDEGLIRRFAATAPPAGWHLWHIARWADRIQASFPNHAFEDRHRWGLDRQIWVRERLSDRWGLDPTALGLHQTGASMGDDAAASLPARVPGESLRTYARDAFRKLDAVVVGLDAKQLAENRNSIMEYRVDEQGQMLEAVGAETTVAADLAFHLSHASRHLGSMEALRGLLEMRGSATV